MLGCMPMGDPGLARGGLRPSLSLARRTLEDPPATAPGEPAAAWESPVPARGSRTAAAAARGKLRRGECAGCAPVLWPGDGVHRRSAAPCAPKRAAAPWNDAAGASISDRAAPSCGGRAAARRRRRAAAAGRSLHRAGADPRYSLWTLPQRHVLQCACSKWIAWLGGGRQTTC